MDNSSKGALKLFDNQIEGEFSEVWLNSKQAAKYLNVSTNTLLNMTSNGRIPYCKLGRSNRYLLEDLRRLLFTEKRGPDGN